VAIPPSCNDPGQVVHTHVPLSPSSIIWYWLKGGNALWLKGNCNCWPTAEFSTIITSMLLVHVLKVGFHYPSSRPELTARELGCIFWHPSTRAVNSGSGNWTPHGLCTLASGFHYPSWRPKLTGVKKCTRVHGPSTRVVETDLKYVWDYICTAGVEKFCYFRINCVVKLCKIKIVC